MISVLFSLLQVVEVETPKELDAFALTFMLVSMGAVTLLTIWCYARILGGQKHFDPDGTGPAHSPVPGEVERDEEV